MREALTVVGFLLILVFAALFTAPLYVDWNSWREDIAVKLTQHFGTPVIIKGPIEARLLPQPWLSLGNVSIGDPYGNTRLEVAGIDGDVSLGGLLRGDVDLSNVVVRSPSLTLSTDDIGLLEPLAQNRVSLDAAVESFEVRGGSVKYIDKARHHDITLTGINLVGESRSLFGPYKAEGGAQFAGVPHTIKLTTGVAEDGRLGLRLTAVPADRPVTLDIDGEVKVEQGKPSFAGNVILARPAFEAKAAGEGGDAGAAGVLPTPWSISGPVTVTPEALTSEKVAIQVGPDERALKLTGGLGVTFGPDASLRGTFAGKQLQLDRFAGVGPDKRTPPAAVMARVLGAMPGLAGLPLSVRLDVSVDGMMLGGELMQKVRSTLATANGQWRVDHLESDMPGKSHLLLAGDVNGGHGGFKGNLSLRSDQATGLIGWLQGAPVLGRPDAAKKLALQADLVFDSDSVDLSKLTLAIDQAQVDGQLAWRRLAPGKAAGRVEANLTAQRIDLDVLPGVAALLPGSSDIFSEADVRLAARELALAGIEARSVTGRIKAGGKLIALEDVVVNDLGGANLSANGRIDNVGAQPQGEIRVVLNGQDLTGLATALKRSTLPAYWVNAFASRAGVLSPANASLTVSFGASRRYTVDGKFGGSVIQLATEFPGEADAPITNLRLKADSFDVATLLRQAGLAPAPGVIPGRASLQLALDGRPNAAMDWNASFSGAGLDFSGNGSMSGPLETPSLDGRVKLNTDDATVPAQLFGLALPGAMPRQGVTLESGLRFRSGRIVLADLTGSLLGMPVSGALDIATGRPLHIDGRLAFQRADGELLASLVSGVDLGVAATEGNAFASEPFGAGTFDDIVGKFSVSADTLVLSRSLPDLEKARATLSFGPGRIDVDDFAANLSGGTLGGALQLSHAGLDTAAAGHFQMQGVSVRTQDVAGTLGASLDFQGTGGSPQALMSSLTGGGTVELRSPTISGLAGDAFAQTVSAVDGGLAADAARVKPAFEANLAMDGLNANAINGNLTLAGGVLRLASTLTSAGDSSLALSGLLDLSNMTVRANLALTPPDPKDRLGGPAPTIPVEVSGPVAALQRDVDVSGLVAWLSIRGVEQQALKLEQLEAQRRAEEKVQEDARRAEAEQMQRAIDAARRKAQSTAVPAISVPQLAPAPVAPLIAPAPLGSPAPIPGLSNTPVIRQPSLKNLPGLPVTRERTTVVPAQSLPLQSLPDLSLPSAKPPVPSTP